MVLTTYLTETPPILLILVMLSQDVTRYCHLSSPGPVPHNHIIRRVNFGLLILRAICCFAALLAPFVLQCRRLHTSFRQLQSHPAAVELYPAQELGDLGILKHCVAKAEGVPSVVYLLARVAAKCVFEVFLIQ